VATSEVEIGEVHGPFEVVVDGDRVARYLDATQRPEPDARGAVGVPPTFLAMVAYERQGAAFAAIPGSVLERAGARVHGEHDLRVRRPLVPGEVLLTTTRIAGVRTNRAGSLVIQAFEHRDGAGELVAEQWWTLFLGGVALREAGDAAPDHAFPHDARARPLGQFAVEPAHDAPRHYAEVSGDWSDHHFDPVAAARSGAPRPFLHGLWTLAVCGHAVAETAAGGAATRVRRVAARFAAPALIGHGLVVDLFDAGDGRVAFEVTCGDAVVVRNGLAEVAPS
jgi:acyl dehydratase